MKIYLASKSPRRQELLKQMGVEFEYLAQDVPEIIAPNEKPEAYSLRVVQKKLEAARLNLIQNQLVERPILCADTEVVLDDHIVGKPQDYEDAFRMLKLYSGRSHEVITSVALQYRDYQQSAINRTKVYFATMTDKDIHLYLESNDYKDKAGAYGIQSQIGQFIYKIEGCFYSVMGLPLHTVRNLLDDIEKLATPTPYGI